MAHERNELQSDWMLVQVRESEPIAVDESELSAQQENTKLAYGMKTYYISHGSAKELLENSMKIMSNDLKAVLIISPSEQSGQKPHVCVTSKNETNYNFPWAIHSKHFEIKSKQKGTPDIARRVKELLLQAGIKTVIEDTSRSGMESAGAWAPLSSMCPNEEIPVYQLSVQSRRDGVYHYNLGRALSPLKHEGVLVLGSGITATKSFGCANFEDNSPPEWALAFENWLKDCLLNNRFEEVIEFEERKGHPSPQQIYPLLVALGAAGEGAKAQSFHNGWTFSQQS